MAQFYSACDVTLGIGLGEGAGYPLFESTSCGTPVVHGNYGGGPEYLTAESLVEPMASTLASVQSFEPRIGQIAHKPSLVLRQ